MNKKLRGDPRERKEKEREIIGFVHKDIGPAKVYYCDKKHKTTHRTESCLKGIKFCSVVNLGPLMFWALTNFDSSSVGDRSI